MKSLFVDKEGIICSRNRITKSHVHTVEIIKPIILASNHPLTVLIRDCHKRCKHLGIANTLNKAKLSGCWVLKTSEGDWHCVRNLIH